MTLTLALIYQLTSLRKRGFDFEILFGYYFHLKLRGTQRAYSSKPLNIALFQERVLVFKR